MGRVGRPLVLPLLQGRGEEERGDHTVALEEDGSKRMCPPRGYGAWGEEQEAVGGMKGQTQKEQEAEGEGQGAGVRGAAFWRIRGPDEALSGLGTDDVQVQTQQDQQGQQEYSHPVDVDLVLGSEDSVGGTYPPVTAVDFGIREVVEVFPVKLGEESTVGEEPPNL